LHSLVTELFFRLFRRKNNVLGTNTNAILNGGTPTLNEKSRADIWYSFTATTNSSLEILSNADFSDVMAVCPFRCHKGTRKK